MGRPLQHECEQTADKDKARQLTDVQQSNITQTSLSLSELQTIPALPELTEVVRVRLGLAGGGDELV